MRFYHFFSIHFDIHTVQVAAQQFSRAQHPALVNPNLSEAATLLKSILEKGRQILHIICRAISRINPPNGGEPSWQISEFRVLRGEGSC